MWPWTLHQRSGGNWILPIGPWCWRTTGTWSRFVRTASPRGSEIHSWGWHEWNALMSLQFPFRSHKAFLLGIEEKRVLFCWRLRIESEPCIGWACTLPLSSVPPHSCPRSLVRCLDILFIKIQWQPNIHWLHWEELRETKVSVEFYLFVCLKSTSLFLPLYLLI